MTCQRWSNGRRSVGGLRQVPPPRSGFTVLEVQVALLILGIALAGLCPLVAMQQRLVKKLDTRVPAYATYNLSSGGVWVAEGTSPLVIYYVVPFTEPTALSLAQGLRQNASDNYVAFAPTQTVNPSGVPTNGINLLSLDYQTDLHGASALVQVQP